MDIYNPVDPINTSKIVRFEWPTKDPDGETSAWRSVVEVSLGDVIQEVQRARPGFRGRNTHAVRELTKSLVLRAAERKAPFENESGQHKLLGKGAHNLQGSSKDRRAVLLFLARAYGQWTDTQHNGPGYTSPMASDHVHHWLRQIIQQAWQGVPHPDWLPADAGRTLAAFPGFPGRDVADGKMAYRPWKTDKKTGLQGDLAYFLDALVSALDKQTGKLASPSFQIVNACITLRALGAINPERMPESTVLLVDKLEDRINMLYVGTTAVISPMSYGIIRSAWDRHVLSSVNGPARNSDAASTFPRPRRSL